MTDSDEESKWSDESGRRADPDRVIDVIERTLARLDVDTVSDDPEQRQFWSWSNPRSRAEVREAFAGDFRQQESLLPGFGPAGYANNARDDSGEAYPFLCNSCGQTVEFGRTCSQSSVCAVASRGSGTALSRRQRRFVDSGSRRRSTRSYEQLARYRDVGVTPDKQARNDWNRRYRENPRR
ncbi:hypothetical protein [Halogeometricum sp. CBA1124]|uniref:hypothetical protein n=1 Tax=Halogeometricum sp. CBA1124 TaxID=2668071 RepID=UPI00142C75CB|nr:hypothetical protein [Halogeometricum sp. CBA1124]MUV56568.1 hypothetical protein [Halogeometricum sp. CBA1124]